MIKIKFKVPIKELSNISNTLVLDGNKRYTVYCHGVKMYTGNNPFKFTFWKWFAKQTGNYSIWVNKGCQNK